MSAVIERPAGPIQESATSIIQVIERAALNPDIDVEKMERLLAMQERILTHGAKMAFNDAMRAAQSEMPKIKRNRENKETHSKYADLEAVTDQAVPIYTKHGFSVSYGTADCPITGHYRVTALCAHSGGYERQYQADVPIDNTGPKGTQNKTMTHGFGSTMSYGRRYLICLIFNITLTNEDKDGNQPGSVITEDQVTNLMDLAKEVKADRQKFLAYMNVEQLADIAAKDYQKAVKALEAKRGR
jgi:hypothetical protein